MKSTIILTATSLLSLLCGVAHALPATPPHHLEPNAPRSVTVSEAQTPPVTLTNLPDDKLTSFALRLALTGHTEIPREGEFDFLTESEAAFVSLPTKKKAITKMAKKPTPSESSAKATAKPIEHKSAASKRKIAA